MWKFLFLHFFLIATLFFLPLPKLLPYFTSIQVLLYGLGMCQTVQVSNSAIMLENLVILVQSEVSGT